MLPNKRSDNDAGRSFPQVLVKQAFLLGLHTACAKRSKNVFHSAERNQAVHYP